jgi:hypothetical protein
MRDTLLQFYAEVVYNSRYDKVPIHVTCVNRTCFFFLSTTPTSSVKFANVNPYGGVNFLVGCLLPGVDGDIGSKKMLSNKPIEGLF